MSTTISDTLAQYQTAAPAVQGNMAEGQKIAESLLNDFGGKTGYIQTRNNKISEMDTLADGEQSMIEFLDFMGIDGKEAYVNMDIKPLKILPAYVHNIVQRFMERDERPTVEAIDEGSLEEKKKAKDNAEFRLLKGQEISELQQGVPVPLEDPGAYTPTDEDDLEFYFEEEWQDPLSIEFQKKIYNTLLDNAYAETKRKLINNIVRHGMLAVKVFKDKNGRTKIRVCKNQNMVYGYSERDDFGDCTVIGERRKYKVVQFRTMFPEIPEMKVFEYYKKSNPSVTTDWDDRYRDSSTRFYDDAHIDVLEFDTITAASKQFLTKKTRNNKTIVLRAEPDKDYGNMKPVHMQQEVVYCGVYVESAREMVQWKLAENMIIPHKNMGEVMSSYVVIIPNNTDMKPRPIIDRVVTSIRMMCFTHLKIMQLMLKMRPDGVAIDIDGLQDVDLGSGPMSPLKLQAISDQTGYYYYKSIGDDGETRRDIPVKAIENNNIVSKLQSLITNYNFYQEQLRSVIGVNEYTEGRGVSPKTGLGVIENQVTASNRNTEFIYEAFIKGLEGIAKRIAVLKWYDIINCVESFSASPIDMMSKRFDLTISMLPTEQERQYLESLINNALGTGAITMEEAFKLRNLAKKNVKLAEKYLGIYERKRQQQKLQEAQANIQMNNEGQLQSNQQTHNNLLQLEELKGSMKIKVQESANSSGEMNDLAKFAREVALEAFKTGKEIPPELKPIVDQYLQGAAAQNQLGMVNKQLEASAIAQQMQQEQPVAE